MKDTNKIVSVIAPARLHMGFIDLSGSLGRYFGSIGVALHEISTRLTVQVNKGGKLIVEGASATRAEECVRILCKALKVSDQLQIKIESAIPEHVGLGSGTQMSLAIGSAINELYDLGLSIQDIAQLTDRGMRSGIGIGVFEQGGLVVDGGRGEQTIIPPVISHMTISDEWQFILVFDQRGQGLHGDQELIAFKELPVFPHQEAAKLCYLLLMQGLPALAEQDIKSFGDVITQIQQSVGDYFSPAQGGVFTSSEVSLVMEWLKQQGAVAIGQTSWGPTGFCMVDNKQKAELLINQLQQKFFQFNKLSYIVTRACNRGGHIEIH